MKFKKTMGMKSRIIRWATLAVSTAFFLFFSHVVSEHAICPIGGFELFFTGIFRTGFTLAGLFSAMVVTFLIMSVLSIFFRRAYCAYICPLGALQELFDRIGARILPSKIRELKIPAKLDRVLRWIKYLTLASFIILAGVIGGHWMIKADPFIALMSLGSIGSILSGFARNPGSFIFLALILIFAFFQGRGFCKYICPAGAWYALLSKISPNRVVRDAHSCVGCGACSRACPMGIDVKNVAEVRSVECIGCRECVNVCPKKGSLKAPVAGIDVPSALVPIASLAVFAGAVFTTANLSVGDRGHRPGVEKGGDGLYQGGNPESNANKPVGFGGCPTCVGCGFCGTSAKA